MDLFQDNICKLQNDQELLSFCREKILHGTPYVFLNRESEWFAFKKRISDHFNINENDIYIVGSAKLGFSPHKETIFSLESDIDVAIVSDTLYDEIMKSIYAIQVQIRRKNLVFRNQDMDQYHRFLEYTVLGWIRPDLLPVNLRKFQNNWFQFFRSISNGQSEVGN